MFAFALLLSAVLPAAFALPANNSAPYGYNIHPNGNKNKCVDLRGDVQSDGTLVQIYDCNGSDAQRWTIPAFGDAYSPDGHLIPTSESYLQIAGTPLCLDAGSNPGNNVQAKVWGCYSTNETTPIPAQDWTITGDNRIALTGKGQCLDLTNGDLTNSNVLQTYHCTKGNTNQIWTTSVAKAPSN